MTHLTVPQFICPSTNDPLFVCCQGGGQRTNAIADELHEFLHGALLSLTRPTN